MAKKPLSPGDLVLGLSNEKTRPGQADLTMRSGIVVGVTSGDRETHHGCELRLLVLWGDGPTLSLECDCGVILPLDIGM